MSALSIQPDQQGTQQAPQAMLQTIPRPILGRGDTALNTADIAQLLGCTRAHATNRVTKLPDFPAPVIDLSERMRWWSLAAIQSWLAKRRKCSK
ncbi:hypothetical protein PMI14_05847 [Acidovorax sp. CF316]|uniref:hypothetical protein n=1 Tax=Acidovorax sp. CF316 TaxID=1144317 RepID=UPI00026BC807|nr:hypothetical protein [Acidovorax sp. CF316]EJE49604.1 hypothetical protein PMI14_05847 [Acidovorax sp. CF316]